MDMLKTQFIWLALPVGLIFVSLWILNTGQGAGREVLLSIALVLCALGNARQGSMMWKRGEITSGWIAFVVATFCGVVAMAIVYNAYSH